MKRAVVLVVASACAATLGWWVVSQRGRSDAIERSPVGPDSIVMLGDSITAGTDWQDRLPGIDVSNEGHPGFTTRQLLPIARSVAERRPRAVFVLAGTNDVRDGLGPQATVAALSELLGLFAEESPGTRVVVQTILPRAETADAIVETNRAIVELVATSDAELLDLHAVFDDGDGGLRPVETTDGWHLSERGYDRWADVLAGVLADDRAG